MPTCRDCALWDIDAAKDKAGVVRRNRAAICLWVSSENWPMSVRGFSRPAATHTTAEQGNGCPCFVDRGIKKK